MINRLILNFVFDDKIRNDLSFSDSSKIRLNTEDKSNPKLQLKLNGNKYPTDNDIYVETPLITPNKLNKWLSFEVRYIESYGTRSIPENTSLGFKIKTTGDNYFWNGASWAVAGLSDWSTESEIRDNIETFPISTIGNKSIGMIINIKTSDNTVTPEIKELKLLGEFDIEFYEDLIYDSIIRNINLNFRSTSVVVIPTYSSVNSIDIGTFLENKGYNITGIKKVINITDDSLELVNLFQNYVYGPLKPDGFTYEYGIINLNATVPEDKFLKIEFEHIPEIIIKTGQDYFEIPVYPSIVFTQINEIKRRNFMLPDTNSVGVDYVRNKDSNESVEQYSPTQKCYRFNYSVFTNNQTDQLRIMKDFNCFLGLNRQFVSWGTGCKFDILPIQSLDTIGNSKVNDSTDTNLSTGSFDVLGILFYDKYSKDIPLVQRINTNYNIQ